MDVKNNKFLVYLFFIYCLNSINKKLKLKYLLKYYFILNNINKMLIDIVKIIDNDYLINSCDILKKTKYSTTFKGKKRSDNNNIIIKVLDKHKSYEYYGNLLINMRYEEIRNLQLLDENNVNFIPKIINSYETNKYSIIVLEYIQGINLSNYYDLCGGGFTKKQVNNFYKKTLNIISQLHENNIVHLDIKLENIIYDEVNNNIYLIDFGFSKNVSQNNKLVQRSGSISYVAPEVIKEGSYDGKKADIWSCGILLHVMTCGYFPFCGNSEYEIKKKIIKGKYKIPDNLSIKLSGILHNLLNSDPNSRYDTNDILLLIN